MKAAMDNGSIASAILDEGTPVRMLVIAVKSAMGKGSNASAVKQPWAMAAWHQRCSMNA